MESKRADDDASVAPSEAGIERAAAALTTFDFSSIDDMDPALKGGFEMAYDREVPVEMRYQEGDEASALGTLEAVRAKILVMGEGGEARAVKVELSAESDLFFHFTHLVDERAYKTIQEEQKLIVDFVEYPSVLAKMFNNAIKEPHMNLAVFVMHRDGHARLDFIQNMAYKFVELLSASFMRSADEVVRDQITFRYNAMKSRLAMMQARLLDVNNLVKIKNPSLLLKLQRSQQPSKGGPKRVSAPPSGR